jgi:predicted O-methyltransferase YrrM
MDLSNPQRVAKLASHLLQHPGNVPRYITDNVITRKAPVELELPWFAYAAIDFLKHYLRREMRVFEFGSGGSTLFLAQRCKSVTSVEDNAHWREIVAAKVTRRGVKNVDLRHVPVAFTTEEAFAASDYLQAVRQSVFDVIVVDGTEWTSNIRPICFRAAEEQIKFGGIIVVDDSWRYRQLRQMNRAQRFEIFESVGPARFGVTSTDVYFY